MLHGADREAGIGEIEIFPTDAQTAAELAGATGVDDQLKARDAGGEFALDDLDRRDLGVALVDGDSGRAVLGGARAGAAGDDLVLHIALAGIGAAAAENDGTAAAAVGAHLAGHDVAHGVEDGVDQRMDGRVVGVDRRGEARVEHAAVARRHGEAAQQAARHIHVRVDQRDQRIGAGRLHQRRADIRGPFGLVGRAAEIEMQPVGLFVDDDMDAHRLFQFHAVVVDEPLRLEAAVRPFRNCRFELCFRHLQEAAEAREGLFPAEFSH